MFWPRQGFPSKKVWTLWSRTKREAFNATERGVLCNPLGAWTNGIASSHRDYLQVFDVNKHLVYPRDSYNSHWRQFTTDKRCRSEWHLVEDSIQSPSFGRLLPCLILSKPHLRARLPQYDLKQTEESVQAWERFLLSNPVSPYSMEDLAQTVSTSSSLSIATDGSVADGVGALGWVIHNPDTGEHLATNYGPVAGDPEKIVSFRAEVFALLCVLMFLRLLSTYHERKPTQTITIHCDNQGLLNRICALQRPTPAASLFSRADNDAVVCITRELQAANTVKLHHVKSHQDL